MKDNSKTVAIVLVILTIVVLIISFITNSVKEEEQNDLLIVTNYSNFYTVNSCLYRMVTYLSTNDKESLLLLLNDEYKSKNKITQDNILNVLPKVPENSSFVSEKMYYENLSNNTVKYYVKGYIKEDEIYDGEILEKDSIASTYFIVYLDSTNNIFSIEPYDGKIFIEGDANET